MLCQFNPPLKVGEIIFDDEIPCGDEIRLGGVLVDLISSAKQISSELREDFIAIGDFILHPGDILLLSFCKL